MTQACPNSQLPAAAGAAAAAAVQCDGGEPILTSASLRGCRSVGVARRATHRPWAADSRQRAEGSGQRTVASAAVRRGLHGASEKTHSLCRVESAVGVVWSWSPRAPAGANLRPQGFAKCTRSHPLAHTHTHTRSVSLALTLSLSTPTLCSLPRSAATASTSTALVSVCTQERLDSIAPIHTGNSNSSQAHTHTHTHTPSALTLFCSRAAGVAATATQRLSEKFCLQFRFGALFARS